MILQAARVLQVHGIPADGVGPAYFVGPVRVRQHARPGPNRIAGLDRLRKH